jgi:hypothetical protein
MPDEKLIDEVVRTDRVVQRAPAKRDLALVAALDAGWSQVTLARELGITQASGLRQGQACAISPAVN